MFDDILKDILETRARFFYCHRLGLVHKLVNAFELKEFLSKFKIIFFYFALSFKHC